MQQIITDLHAEFIRLTEQGRLPILSCERRWLDWIKEGFTMDDLKIVLCHVKRQNARNDYKFSLRFALLIGDTERFGDLLGEASAWETRQKRIAEQNYSSAKQEILRVTGRDPQKPLPEPKRVQEFLNGAIDRLRDAANNKS